MELTIGSVLAFVLVFVAVFFGMRQRRTLAQLRDQPEMADEERNYLTRQVRRRLVCSALLIVLAGFIIGWFFIEQDRARDLVPPEGQPLSEAAKDQVRFLVYYWSAALLLLLVVLFLASWDFLATARYGFSKHKQLEQDRRAMLEIEAANLRRRRQELN